MDEHLSILEGKTIEMEHKFIDDSRIPIGQFTSKHENYASREAVLLLDAEYKLTNTASMNQEHGREVEKKRAQKEKYARMPLFWRAFAYFVYRYIVKLGFLDGKEGFCWDFFQGLWYRMLVDAKIYECKKTCGDNPEAIKKYIAEHWGIKI